MKRLPSPINEVRTRRYEHVNVPYHLRCLLTEIWEQIFSYGDSLEFAGLPTTSRWAYNLFWAHIQCLKFRSHTSPVFLHTALQTCNPQAVTALVVATDRFTDATCQVLPGTFINLEHVVFRECDITDVGLGCLGDLKHLTYVDIGGCPRITSEGLSRIGKITSLTVLSVSGFIVTGSSVLGHLSELRELTYLGLDSRNKDAFPDTEFSYLLNMPKLKTLALSLCGRDGDGDCSGFSAVGQLTELRVLCMVHQFCDEDSCRALKGLKKLEKLVLFSPKLTDRAIKQCCTLPNLKSFSMGGDITDAGLLHLSKLTNLERISITSRTITDQGVQYLSRQTGLQEIDLKCSPLITDDGLHYLTLQQNLKSICFQELPGITDNGLQKLSTLHLLKQLEVVRCTQVTHVGVEKLVHSHGNTLLVDLRTVGIGLNKF